MRRSMFWGVVVLPVVLVVGHPVVVALLPQPQQPTFWFTEPEFLHSACERSGYTYEQFIEQSRPLLAGRGMATKLSDEPPIVQRENDGHRLRWMPPERYFEFSLPVEKQLVKTVGYGWPFVCLAHDRELYGRTRFSGVEVRFLGDYRRGVQSEPQVIPTRIVWSGLLLNWLIVASVCAAVVLLPHCTVRARRRRRGACLACGYDVGDLERCPECGAERPGVRSASA